MKVAYTDSAQDRCAEWADGRHGPEAPTADIAPAAKLSILRRHKVGNDRGFSRPSISSSDEIFG